MRRRCSDPAQATLIALGLACVVALAIGLRITHAPFAEGLREGRRLLDALGWAALLPMVLATLGSVFASTGVGDAIAAIVGATIPADNRLACVAAFALGMVVFTMIMGIPRRVPGDDGRVGLPLLVLQHHRRAGVARRDRHAHRLIAVRC